MKKRRLQQLFMTFIGGVLPRASCVWRILINHSQKPWYHKFLKKGTVAFVLFCFLFTQNIGYTQTALKWTAYLADDYHLNVKR